MRSLPTFYDSSWHFHMRNYSRILPSSGPYWIQINKQLFQFVPTLGMGQPTRTSRTKVPCGKRPWLRSLPTSAFSLFFSMGFWYFASISGVLITICYENKCKSRWVDHDSAQVCWLCATKRNKMHRSPP